MDLQEKRNKIESEVFRVKEKQPDVERYLETIKNMNSQQLDQILRELNSVQ